MTVVLICTPVPLQRELAGTILARQEVERHYISRYEEGISMALAHKPNLILIHGQLPRAHELIEAIRADSRTKDCGVVAIAESSADSSNLPFLRSGVNAVLRLPPTPEWDKTFERLLRATHRQGARFVVRFAVLGKSGRLRFTGHTINL